MRQTLLLLLVCLGAWGCDAVPDVTYTSSDASVDGNTCPDQVPSYASSCCGPIPCFGSGCAAACTECQKCSALDLCCPTTAGMGQQVVCKSTRLCQ